MNSGSNIQDVLDGLPDVCFPHELDVLRIACSGDIGIRISCGALEFCATLTPSGGVVNVEGLAPMLRDFVGDEPGTVEFELSDGSGSRMREIEVLPCDVMTSLPAKEFTDQCFLCLTDAQEAKRTCLGHPESLSVYYPSLAQNPQGWGGTVRWLEGTALKTAALNPGWLQTVMEGDILRADVSPDRINAHMSAGRKLLDYEVTLGSRKRRYVIDRSAEPGATVTLHFLNAFHQPETLHFTGGLELDEKAQRYAATFGSATLNYRILRTPELTLRTLIASPFEAEMVAQCAASKDILLRRNGSVETVRCTDSSVKLPASSAEMATASVTLRYAEETPPEWR